MLIDNKVRLRALGRGFRSVMGVALPKIYHADRFLHLGCPLSGLMLLPDVLVLSVHGVSWGVLVTWASRKKTLMHLAMTFAVWGMTGHFSSVSTAISSWHVR
jgi:hypothetical protein